MISNVVKNAAADKKKDRDGGKYQTHMFLKDRSLQNSNNPGRKKAFSFGIFSIVSSC